MKEKVYRLKPCSSDTCRDGGTPENPCPWYQGNEEKLFTFEKRVMRIYPKGSGTFYWHGDVSNLETLSASSLADMRHFEQVDPTEYIRTLPLAKHNKTSCPHNKAKLVPLGIGGNCKIINVCCNCGEEI